MDLVIKKLGGLAARHDEFHYKLMRKEIGMNLIYLDELISNYKELTRCSSQLRELKDLMETEVEPIVECIYQLSI